MSDRILAAHAATQDQSRPEAVARQHDRGKLTARERIRILTGDATFVEFGALVTPGGSLDSGDLLGDGVVTGIGYIDGRPAAIAAFDFTVLGGSNGEVGMSKIERCAARCLHDRIPLVLLCDGGGHRIQEGLDSRLAAVGSQMLARLVDLSGLVPTVTVMMGPGFGLAANLAAMCDLVVVVRGIGTIGMSAAPFVRAGTGEDLSNEEIGGADIQAERGVADIAAADEYEALAAVRAYLSYLPPFADGPLPRASAVRAVEVDLDSIVPEASRMAYDMLDVVEALADAESILEIRPTAAPNIVTGLARIDGRPLGVIGNQPRHLGGALDAGACEKAAHLAAVCDAFGLPILILIDLPGFLIGSAAESTQLARRSGRLMFELGRATVPRFSIVVRKGYGAAYIAMGGGRSIDADLSIAWPSAEISAMPIESAVDIAFGREFKAASDPASYREELIARFRAKRDPLRAASGFGIDDVVMPSATRTLLIESLSRCRRHTDRVPGKRRTISPI
ncbi:acyl-CoA carboxylase subunit beta [Gordonia polyisoprenivorans]|uniref:acyl-CoA carboxylase subunit beta n=1 Tax=Gordonia polyisoprenivorans TaxID=84595 RepID=UPI001AD6B252|nr:carboxyl transferase domain-containing protein [Gordonia polyisoprenivorans]QTI69060.1 methylmalonyl-CoA carboxyltransferase [Gordonia polyisoprenivorans]